MKKRRYLKNTAIGLVSLVLLLLVWAAGIEPRLVAENAHTAGIPRLPSSWEGKRIVLIADLQVGMWLDNTDTIQRIVDRIIEIRPAAALIAGDFVYNPTNDEADDLEREEFLEFKDSIDQVMNLLRPLSRAGIRTYAVLGNHDYGMPTAEYAKNELLARSVHDGLQNIGIRVLDNDAVAITSDGKGQNEGDALYLIGIGPRVAGRDHPQVALASVPRDAPRIALMHHPDSFADFPEGSAPLALAGHTHGGQIRIPFTPHWSWMRLLSNDQVHADGWIEGFGKAGNRLYVNRGIGFSVVPMRLNCLPELTIFTLHRQR